MGRCPDAASARPLDAVLVFWTMIKGLAMHHAAFGEKFARPDPRTLARVFFVEDP